MTQSPGAQFERLLEIMRRLREPGGCPWDREQTRASLQPFLVEETYEVLEAIESGEAEAVREELGDLLLQVVFHAQIAAERGEFDMAALLARLVDKMISRHPHVFGETTLGTPGEALAQWEAIKQRERSEEHTSELQSLTNLVCRLLLEKKKKKTESEKNKNIGDKAYLTDKIQM